MERSRLSNCQSFNSMSKIPTCQPVKNKRNSKIKYDIEEDVLCLSCFKPFSNSLPGAVWIQCSSCQWWAHASCVKEDINGLYYKCLYCNDSIVPLDEDIVLGNASFY